MTVRRAGVVALAVLVVGALVLVLRGGDDDTKEGDSAHSNATGSGAQGSGRRDARVGGGTAAARKGKRIAGVVVDGHGAPVHGAEVRLGAARIVGARPVVVTDDAGRFDFGARAVGQYVVAAERRGSTAAVTGIDLDEPVAHDALRLVLDPCDASIHGVVRDAAGGVIPGARVAPLEEFVPAAAGVEVDAAGAFELCLPAGGALVMVTADGYATQTDAVSVFGRMRRDFTLVPAAAIAGRVVRAADGVAVTDALVSVRATDPRQGWHVLTALSDADGRFAIDGVAPGRVTLAATADGLATADVVDAVAEVGTVSEVVIEVVATFVIAGKVVEKGTTAPVAATRISLGATTGGRMRELAAFSATDGTFEIANVVPGDYTAWAQVARSGDGMVPVRVEDADVRDLVFEVARRASIAGRVVYAGKPVHGATVRTAGAQTTAAADGTFVLRGLEAGTHRVYAESQRLGAFTQGPEVVVAEREDKTGVEVALDLAGSISGIVVDQNDAPVAGAHLMFTLLSGSDYGQATTADDGTFTARALSGGGEYRFEVRPRDGSQMVYPPLSGKRHPPVAVADGSSKVTGLRVRVRVERLAIGGRVVDEKGQPVPDATVFATARDGWYAPHATTDERGAFAIRDVTPGTYTLTTSTARGDAKLDKVEAGRANVVLTLVGAGRIEGTLQGFAKRPEVVAWRMGPDHGRLRAKVTGTTFTFADVPAGTYRVFTSGSSHSEQIAVTVTAGQTSRVALTARPTGSVAGTLVDKATRAPIAGAWCLAVSRASEEDVVDERAFTRSRTDARGAFLIGDVPEGRAQVYCSGRNISADGVVDVTAGQTATIALSSQGAEFTQQSDPGMTVEDKLGDAVVTSVAADGPAARAGIRVGDIVVQLEDEKLGDNGAGYVTAWLTYADPGSTAKLVLERDDKTLTVSLTVVAKTP